MRIVYCLPNQNESCCLLSLLSGVLVICCLLSGVCYLLSLLSVVLVIWCLLSGVCYLLSLLSVCSYIAGPGCCPQDLKSDLVYARISGYGQTGPKAHLAGYASVCEAYGGFR